MQAFSEDTRRGTSSVPKTKVAREIGAPAENDESEDAELTGLVEATDDIGENAWKMLTTTMTDNDWGNARFWQENTFDQSA